MILILFLSISSSSSPPFTAFSSLSFCFFYYYYQTILIFILALTQIPIDFLKWRMSNVQCMYSTAIRIDKDDISLFCEHQRTFNLNEKRLNMCIWWVHSMFVRIQLHLPTSSVQRIVLLWDEERRYRIPPCLGSDSHYSLECGEGPRGSCQEPLSQTRRYLRRTAFESFVLCRWMDVIEMNEMKGLFCRIKSIKGPQNKLTFWTFILLSEQTEFNK